MTPSELKAELEAELKESKELLASYDLDNEERTPAEEAEYLFHWKRVNEIEQELILLEKNDNEKTKRVTMTDIDEWDFESNPFVSLAIDGRGVLDGHATIRAVNSEGIVALFQCPGKGRAPHCFSRADEIARSAGFTPIGNFYERKVRGQPWLARLNG